MYHDHNIEVSSVVRMLKRVVCSVLPSFKRISPQVAIRTFSVDSVRGGGHWCYDKY
jgi:hypothetical protein